MGDSIGDHYGSSLCVCVFFFFFWGGGRGREGGGGGARSLDYGCSFGYFQCLLNMLSSLVWCKCPSSC